IAHNISELNIESFALRATEKPESVNSESSSKWKDCHNCNRRNYSPDACVSFASQHLQTCHTGRYHKSYAQETVEQDRKSSTEYPDAKLVLVTGCICRSYSQPDEYSEAEKHQQQKCERKD